MSRLATVQRTTTETDIEIRLNLDQPEFEAPATGHGFLDHMLDALARHSRLGLSVRASGDLHIEPHHLIEDAGITLGQALTQALGDRRGIERYGSAFVPMDETLAHVVVDLSGRAHLAFEPETLDVWGQAGGMTHYHLREFLRGLCNHGGVTMHVRLLAGREAHHVIEAIVKALARALRDAVALTSDQLPSTKGSL
ncbi:imidazoleglycerol-phosphate dehydratase HisB [Deinococcus deserti]|uniref:Imidazoleglycerol-phosphate dehydratase n=1 Tax=Deinococcus deserti (strain DSM 17065 / CIP 109153 / LMG 22923 / VCD115) TaxID=546414 RepID=HIS7_DEIDV|nr:imidazoleglycerol-phosphate dehydratase HisB [Deinococcus deserti]C1D1S1.1 RecName: Full=Imidazoleglycerol-phosphate dehydratase; Short=IGPD [Deinococcus deserti VCD115]ACO45795.1 putative Imidazoleglycerol-phosphate dehydratase [Deinococcus deserti VCD115]